MAWWLSKFFPLIYLVNLFIYSVPLFVLLLAMLLFLCCCENLNICIPFCALGSCTLFAGQWNIPEPCVQRTRSHSHHFVPYTFPLHSSYSKSGGHTISQWPVELVSDVECRLKVPRCLSLFSNLSWCEFSVSFLLTDQTLVINRSFNQPRIPALWQIHMWFLKRQTHIFTPSSNHKIDLPIVWLIKLVEFLREFCCYSQHRTIHTYYR